MIISCTNVHPGTPLEAANTLTASIQPWTAPPPLADALSRFTRLVPFDPNWPFHGPNEYRPAAPLAPPWSVTTFSKGGTFATFFNGQQISGVPLSPLVNRSRDRGEVKRAER